MLLNAVGAESLQAYTDAVLGPLDAADRATELLRGLTAFLEHNGHWAAAANALRVHRHTMRNRIETVERLTGRRMDSAQDRHELWLALRARDTARMYDRRNPFAHDGLNLDVPLRQRSSIHAE